MRKIVFMLIGSALLLPACDEPIPHVLFDEVDTVQVVTGNKVHDDYEGEIPGLDAKVIDYTLPNPYQHIPQLLRDSTIATSWDEAGFPNAKNFIIFFKNFQWDVRERHKDRICNLIKFPLRDFANKQAFLQNFDSIFSPDFVIEVLDQNPLEIYRDKKGAMVGDDGQVWFKVIDGKYRIIEINY